MKTPFIVLPLFLTLNCSVADENPDDSVNTSYETFSIHRVRHIVDGTKTYSTSAIGVDDTFETAEADIRPKIAGLPFAPATSNFGRSELLTSEDEFGVTIVQVRHFGRVRVLSHESNYHDSDVNSVCQVLLTPFRISGNTAPISLNIECEIQGSVLRDPIGTAGKSEVEISASHIIRQVSDSAQLSVGYGLAQHDSKLAPPNDVPRFLYDFAAAGGSSIPQGGGQYLSRTSYSKNFLVGYYSRFSLFTQTIGSFVSESLSSSDDESWNVDHISPVIYTISSLDPSVRFLIQENDAPTPRPDLSIGSLPGAFVGTGIQTPSPSNEQSVKIRQGKRKSKMIYLQLENDGPTISGGNGNNSIVFRGPAKRKKLRFSYFLNTEEGTSNITAQAIAGTFVAPPHLPGKIDSIHVQSQQKKTRKKKAKPKKARPVKVDFIASNSGAGGMDLTRALIKTK